VNKKASRREERRKEVPPRGNEVPGWSDSSLIQGGMTMGKNYEITNLRLLNDHLTQTIEVLARAHRIGLNSIGLGHSNVGPTVFGMQGMPVDPRGVDYGTMGLNHSPYGVYPYSFGGQQWTSEMGTWPTFVDPFYTQRGLHHTPGQWPGLSPYAAAELARRDYLARQHYETQMWGNRPFGI